MSNRNKGSTLAFTMIIIMVLAIFTSALVTMLRQETRWELKHRRSSTAFHLAEAAVDRGYWKLIESKDMWDSVAKGTFEDNYSAYVGSGAFSDVEGGTYKITITTTSDEDERKIVGVGRDSSTNEMRMIEVIVKHMAVEAAVSSPDMYVSGNANVHWGPIKSTVEMTLQGNAKNRYYPRKFSVGKIDPRDTNPDTDVPDTGYGNSDNLEYWAYETVPDPPGVDTQYYLEHADEYYGPACEEQPDPAGSVPANFNQHPADDHEDPGRIYYVAGNLNSFKNTYLKGILIVMGDINFDGHGDGTYGAVIPEDAEEEYQHPNAADDWAEFDPPGAGGIYTLNGVIFEGFIYVGRDASASGTPVINGCIQIERDTTGVGNITIYYDQDIAAQVETVDLNVVRLSWKEIKPSW